MTLIKHELRQGRISLGIWTASIGFLLAICVFLFPEMKGQMDGVSQIFASMGGFTKAFGMDRLNFGELIGFYGVECGNILGLGGSFFAALCGVSALSKEEKEHTAEFLLTHSVSRVRIVADKLIAVLGQLVILNAIVLGLALLSVWAIGEPMPWKELLLLHLANFLMQLVLAGICFGLSAFLRGGSLGIGLGIAAIMYFLNIIANLSEKVEFLKYITPFGFTEGADILSNGSLDLPLVLLGLLYGALGIFTAFWHYCRKDIP